MERREEKMLHTSKRTGACGQSVFKEQQEVSSGLVCLSILSAVGAATVAAT